MNTKTHPMIQSALQYVRNSNGGATRGNLIEDYEPVGYQLWADLIAEGLVEDKGGKIYLTKKGEQCMP